MEPRRVLETRFGDGLRFLSAWQAWRDDQDRPRLLHFVSIDASPVPADELVRAAPAPLKRLAGELAARWWGLVPGFHRLAFDDGRVLLTLCVGDVRQVLQELAFEADEAIVDGPADATLLKAVSRLCRRGAVLRAGLAREDDLRQCGFRDGRFDPPWELRRSRVTLRHHRAGHAVVVGAGLAGAAAAASLARRGWQVRVLDTASAPASGASALPAGLLAPHTSPDDNLLSRLSRAGVRMTLDEAAARLQAGQDFERTGSLEKRPEGTLRHEAAAWIKPAALVRAWLSAPGIGWQGHARVARVEAGNGGWQVLDGQGRPLAQADLVVLAAALGCGELHPALALRPVRGQVTWGWREGEPLAPSPLNGHGHFLPRVPLSGRGAWLTGSTYGRGETALEPREEDQQANLQRLRELAPEVAARLEPAFTSGAVRAWTGVRCASPDRRPLIGELEEGLWVSTAMGSRGLTLALLCAELLAARLHGEPLPLPAKLAAALDVARVRPG